MAEVRYTKEQRAAIEERRRTLLVSAAAGSGKTMTLTQRIIASLLDPERPADLSRMLVVTFTNAAAGELKDRIARALESELERSPDNAHLARQLLLLPSAAICTIDSWYSQLLRGYAPTVGLTPNFRIAEAAERDLLRQTVLDTLLESCYDGRAPEVCEGELFVRIAEALSSTREERRELPQTLLHLFELTEGYAEGPALLTRFAERLRAEAALPVHQTLWGGYIMTVTRSFLESTLATLRGALEALRAAEPAEAALYEPVFVSDLSLIEEALQAAEKGYAPLREALLSYSPARLPGLRGKSAAAERAKAARDAFKTERESFCKQFFAYTEEQWGPLMATMGELCGGICRLIQTFAERFEAEKRRRRICDFADLQRYVLRLLYKDGETTPLAAAISEAYDYIYIDEYQDVSPIQHRIFDAVARPDNLFMVGDIKQSIYSFRRAEPEIFASLRRAFPDLSAAGDSPRARLSLSDNFRSNAPVIDFINRVFDTLFGRAGESIGYVPADRLVCGNGVAEGVMPRLYLFENPPKAAPGEDSPPDEPEEGDTEEESAEAEWTAAQIDHLLRHERKPDGAAYLPSDIAILLRSVRGKADPYARALAKRGIRTETTEEKNFFLNPEVLLALCLLNTIDNPKKDIHLCGLLCSPLYDVTPDELVLIRQAADKNLPLYDALLVYCEQHPDFEKGHRFLAALSRFRRMAEGVPVDLLLRRLYSETGLLSLVAREGGQGRENLLALYHHARRFEGSSYQGLYSFIAYVNSLIEEGRSFSDTAQVAGDPFCVQIMTIHHAKGLEFPVCFVGGCGRAFNRSDTKAHLLFHGKLGLGLRMRDSTALARINNPIRNAIADAM
ncbi:MAG: UvrD-helicase domain-containing protein, partial [Eubacteriales bacterium]